MTNSEALNIAANYDIILEMTGIDFGYSLELLEESKKVKYIQDSLEDIQTVFRKKAEGLQGREGHEEEVKIEEQKASAEWSKVMLQDFKGSFTPMELSKIPTSPEQLDKRVNKDGVSIARTALLFLSRKGLVIK